MRKAGQTNQQAALVAPTEKRHYQERSPSFLGSQLAPLNGAIEEFEMKESEIKVGGRYTAKVSGKLTTVEVLEKIDVWFFNKGFVTQYRCKNLSTGREIRIKSCQRFRSMVRPKHSHDNARALENEGKQSPDPSRDALAEQDSLSVQPTAPTAETNSADCPDPTNARSVEDGQETAPACCPGEEENYDESYPTCPYCGSITDNCCPDNARIRLAGNSECPFCGEDHQDGCDCHENLLGFPENCPRD